MVKKQLFKVYGASRAVEKYHDELKKKHRKRRKEAGESETPQSAREKAEILEDVLAYPVSTNEEEEESGDDDDDEEVTLRIEQQTDE